MVRFRWAVALLATAVVGQQAFAAQPTIAATATNIGGRQVTISWDAGSAPSSTELAWGTSPSLDGGYPNQFVAAGTSSALHSVTLRRLPANTYYYRARSVDAVGPIDSAELTFTVRPSDRYPLGDYSLNGEVTSVSQRGGIAWVGGNFTSVGYTTGSGLAVDSSVGNALKEHFPEVAGVVNAVLPDGAGGFYLGGLFRGVGGYPRSGLAHLLPDLGVDPDFQHDVNGGVFSLAMYGTTLYVGGEFKAIDGQPRSNAAAIDVSSGTLNAWKPDPNSVVLALACLAADQVYLGGSFTTVAGSPRYYLALVSAAGVLNTTFNPGPNAAVHALAAHGTTVFAGGAFTTVGTLPRLHAAAFDGTGALLPWNPAPNGNVNAIAADNVNVYLGGEFLGLGPSSSYFAASRAAAVDQSLGTPKVWDPGLNGPVSATFVTGQTLYVGGQFSVAQSGITNTARLNAAAWSIVGGVPATLTAWSPRPNGPVRALWGGGALVFLGGAFTALQPTPMVGLAAFSLADGALLSGKAPTVSGQVNALVTTRTTLYLGGAFSSFGGLSRANAAAWDIDAGTVTSWAPAVSSNNAVVNTLALGDLTVYIGGRFGQINSTSRNNLGAVDLNGGLLPWDPNVDSVVRTLSIFGSQVFAGGEFANVNQNPTPTARSRAAGFNPFTGLVTPWNPDPDQPVLALAAATSGAYLGGQFSSTGTPAQPRKHLSAVDRSVGANLAWATGFNLDVRALKILGGTLYAGGDFTTADGGTLARSRAASMDLAGGALGTWDPDFDGPVDAIDFDCPGTGNAMVGGAFRAAGLAPRGGFAILEGPAPCPPVATDGGIVIGPDGGLFYPDGGPVLIDGGVSDGGTAAADGGKTNPDGGSPFPSELQLQTTACGCASTPGALFAAAGLAALLFGRRRARR